MTCVCDQWSLIISFVKRITLFLKRNIVSKTNDFATMYSRRCATFFVSSFSFRISRECALLFDTIHDIEEKKRLRIERHCQVNNIGSGTQIIRCTVVSKEFSSSSERLVDLPSRSWRLIKPVAFKAYLRFQAYLRCSRIKYCLLQIIVCTCIRTRAMR